MTDLVSVSEWMAERSLHLVEYSIDFHSGEPLTLYLFSTDLLDEPDDGWVKAPDGLTTGVFTTDEGISFVVKKESKEWGS